MPLCLEKPHSILMQEGLLKMQVLVIKGRLKQEITSAHKLNQVAILQNKNTVFI